MRCRKMAPLSISTKEGKKKWYLRHQHTNHFLNCALDCAPVAQSNKETWPGQTSEIGGSSSFVTIYSKPPAGCPRLLQVSLQGHAQANI